MSDKTIDQTNVQITKTAVDAAGTMMISIGTVMKGADLSGSPVDQTIIAVTKAFSELHGDIVFGSSPALNVVFHVPGSMGCPDWDGL